MRCEWCNSLKIKPTKKTAYWELPDGTRAIEISDIESVKCESCGMNYIEESVIEKIEEQLILINTKELSNSLTYQELMAKERLLKKNYFKGL